MNGEVLRTACLYVCLYLYLSARMSQKPHVQTSQNFLYVLPVTVAPSSTDNNTIFYVLPVLWMTSCFNIMELLGRINQTALCLVEFANW